MVLPVDISRKTHFWIVLVLFVSTELWSVDAVQRVERDISLLWYNFTTCGYSGQSGPPHKVCREHYSSSPISPHLLPPILPYDGIQLFQLPRIGRYRIMASGGGGGGGVCNTHPGASPIVEVTSSDIYDRHILEISIGHRGTHACEYKNSSKFCNFNTSEQCSVEWMKEGRPMTEADGGGGGGGGTLVGLRHNGDYRHIFPATILLLVGGGGGASSSLNSSTDTMKNGTYDADLQSPGSGEVESPPGYLYNAGPGGGATLDQTSTSIYGKSFKDMNLYAKGGEDCSLNRVNVMFENTHGGFGGGGGGCASGGGGGGYRGGNTRNHVTDHYPGNGGSSWYLHKPAYLLGWNYGNGFVRIRHEKCGCAHECEIDNNRSVFWCTCPSNTVLSPDGYGCHREEDVTLNISSNAIKTINSSRFGLIEFSSINAIPANKRDDYLKQLLSVRMDMSVETSARPTSNQATESCGVLVLNRNLGIVASLNSFYVEGPLKANYKEQFSVSSLRKVNTDYRDDGSYGYSLDPPTELLNRSVELYSMVLYQTLGVKCTITRMSVNTSVEELYFSTLQTGSVPSDSNLTNYFRVLLVTTTPRPTTSTTSSTTDTLSLWYLYFAIAMAAVLGNIHCLELCY